jgi:NAD(P)H-dependent FMN reductase
MTTPHTVHAFTHIPTSPEDIGAATLLGVCASLKPAPGRQGRSAARSILYYALDTLGAVYPEVFLLDLRDHQLPFFDGQMPHEYDDPALQFVWSCVGRTGALLLSVPAYWSGVSGVFKNFVDTLCGPIYDYDREDIVTTIFANKPVGLLIVGADETSAHVGADQAQQIMLSTGAQLVGQPVVVTNPRSGGIEAGMLSRELIALAAELVRHAHLARERNAW